MNIAFAASNVTETQTHNETASTQETLLAAPPENWQQIYQLNTGDLRLSDFIPPDQTEADWSIKLSFEAHKDLKQYDPIALLTSEAKVMMETCDDSRDFNLHTGMENGYPTSVRLFTCPETIRNKAEFVFSKGIQADDFFYIIKMTRRLPVGEEMEKQEVAEWSQYLRGIAVCVPESTAHPCGPQPDDA